MHVLIFHLQYTLICISCSLSLYFTTSTHTHTLHKRYMEKQGSDRYVPRIYLTEGSGAVLGANFMQDQLVVFDEENSRVGIGRANCEYNHFIRDKVNKTASNTHEVYKNTQMIMMHPPPSAQHTHTLIHSHSCTHCIHKYGISVLI
jgi:hypothetical protein